MIKNKKLNLIIFILTYSLSCLTISSNRIGGYFGYASTDFLILKFVLIFIFVTASVLINKNNLEKLLKFYCIFLNIVIMLYILDYYIFNLSGTGDYYRMWWLSAIYIANAALFCGIYLCFDKNYSKYFKRFWIGFLPTFIVSFTIIFAREHNTYFSVNTKLGKGLISSFDYLVSHFHFNSWPLFSWIGNIAFFIPVSFLLRACFPKLNRSFAIAVCLVIPFLVEGYQYIFKCGNVDIDDIVFNLSGILIGYALMEAGNAVCKKKGIRTL